MYGFILLQLSTLTRKVIQWINSTCDQFQTLLIHNIGKLLLLPGQLVVASLLNRNIKSRLLLRDPEKATSLFGNQDEDKLQVEFSSDS